MRRLEVMAGEGEGAQGGSMGGPQEEAPDTNPN